MEPGITLEQHQEKPGQQKLKLKNHISGGRYSSVLALYPNTIKLPSIASYEPTAIVLHLIQKEFLMPWEIAHLLSLRVYNIVCTVRG